VATDGSEGRDDTFNGDYALIIDPHRIHDIRAAFMKPNVPALILIAIGVLFLLHNLGIANFNLGQLILKWWPLILIVLGVQMLFKRGSPK
jgi:hypothetical protein